MNITGHEITPLFAQDSVNGQNERKNHQPMRAEDIMGIPPTIALVDFLNPTDKQSHRTPDFTEAAKDFGYSSEQADSFMHFASVLDTFSNLSFSVRFQLFSYNVYEDKLSALRKSKHPEDILTDTAQLYAAAFLNVQPAIMQQITVNAANPKFQSAYTTAKGISTMSRSFVRGNNSNSGEDMKPFSTDTYITSEVDRRAEIINNAIAEIMKERNIAWNDVENNMISEKIEKYGLTMTLDQIKLFLSHHRKSHFSHLPPRDTSRALSNNQRLAIFLGYKDGLSHETLGKIFDIPSSTISTILNGEPPLDTDGNPVIYEPREKAPKSYTEEEREIIVSLFRQQQALGQEISLTAIKDVINLRRQAEGKEDISKSAVFRIVENLRNQ